MTQGYPSMVNTLNEQFGATLEMLKQVISACPENFWRDTTNWPSFWYITYHTLHFVDWYLSTTTEQRESFKQYFPEVPYRVGEKTTKELSQENIKEYFEVVKKKQRKPSQISPSKTYTNLRYLNGTVHLF